VSPTNGAITASNLVAETAFDNTINLFNDLRIIWEVSVDSGKNWSWAGNTDHQVYVICTAPSDPKLLRHTALHISTDGAQNAGPHDGKHDADFGDPVKVRAAIWDEFSATGKNKLKIPRQRAQQGVDLTLDKNWLPYLGYYYSWTVTQTTFVESDVPNLIKNGDGQCNAWAGLFLDTLAIQGFASKNTGLSINCTNQSGGAPSAYFMVGKWKFTDPAAGDGSYSNPYKGNDFKIGGGPGKNAYTWLQNAQVTDTVGVAGQNNTHPLSIFPHHQLVLLDGVYYDPSYGLTYPHGLADLDSNVDGFDLFGGIVNGAHTIKVWKNPHAAGAVNFEVNHTWSYPP